MLKYVKVKFKKEKDNMKRTLLFVKEHPIRFAIRVLIPYFIFITVTSIILMGIGGKHLVFEVLIILAPLSLISFTIGIFLLTAGGWTLLVAYLICRFTGACPI